MYFISNFISLALLVFGIYWTFIELYCAIAKLRSKEPTRTGLLFGSEKSAGIFRGIAGIIMLTLGAILHFDLVYDTVLAASPELIIVNENCTEDFYLTSYGSLEPSGDMDYGFECIALLVNQGSVSSTKTIHAELFFKDVTGHQIIARQSKNAYLHPGSRKRIAFIYTDPRLPEITGTPDSWKIKFTQSK